MQRAVDLQGLRGRRKILADPAWRTRLAVPSGEHGRIVGRAGEAEGQPALLLALAVRPQLGHQPGRDRHVAAPVLGFRRLEAERALCLLERALYPHYAL